jgi:hypothetical protein
MINTISEEDAPMESSGKEKGKAGARLRKDRRVSRLPASSVWPHHHPPQITPPRGRGEG